MKNDKTFDDKRLLGVLDGVDQKFIAEALESYDIAEPQRVRKAPIYRRVALLAACLLLITAAFPVVNYVLPRFGVTWGGNAGAGSEDSIEGTGSVDSIDMSEFADMSERDLIEHVGEVPEEFKKIVEQNLFADIRVSGGSKIIKEVEDPYGIEVYDLYGKLLHRIDIKVEKPVYGWWSDHKIHSLSDGTYLLIIPYHKYNGSEQAYKGIVTDARVVRFDEKGNILFNTKLDITDGLCKFEFFYETGDAYLLIGGSYQKWDSYFVKIDKSGKVLKNIQMGGEESDRLYWVYYTDGELVAYMREHTLSQKAADTQKVIMDDSFNILSYNSAVSYSYPMFYLQPSGRWNVRNFVLGYNPQMKDDDIPATGGNVTGVIEYDDFVLIISERDTKMFPYLPMFWSSHCYYTETVYTAHALDGTILWRTAVDSTDYARLVAVKQLCEDERKELEKWMEEHSTSE